MKLAVSNIAWPPEQDRAVAGLLNRLGIRAIEVAPTKIWRDPPAAPDAEVDRYRRFWEAEGVSVIAAQALLFGRPDLTLFTSAADRHRTLAYLRGIIRVCARLGVEVLVFGSPKNRRIGSLPAGVAWPLAVELFGRLAERAAADATTMAIEPNPPAYGADFILRAAEAVELVKAVDHTGLRLHLDTACMALAGDAVGDALDVGFDHLRHFHVSEIDLAPVGSGDLDHAAYARELRRRKYGHWVSVEMRQAGPFSLSTLEGCLRWAQEVYGVEP